ncbi:MAG: hypothetical protein KJO38_05110 [Gammaproteobacteria bacterium]|nr:hypothetical protein [Gammaproteobacteria bacterium]
MLAALPAPLSIQARYARAAWWVLCAVGLGAVGISAAAPVAAATASPGSGPGIEIVDGEIRIAPVDTFDAGIKFSAREFLNPGDRLAVTPGTAFTSETFTPPFGTGQQTVSYGGAVGGFFYTWTGFGWNVDARQIDGVIAASLSYSRDAGAQFEVPPGFAGIGWSTGVTAEQLDLVDVGITIRLANAGGQAGQFVFDDNGLVTDARGTSLFYAPAASFEPDSPGVGLELITPTLQGVRLDVSITPVTPNISIDLPLFLSGSFGFVEVQPIPLPASLPLLAPALAMLLLRRGRCWRFRRPLT